MSGSIIAQHEYGTAPELEAFCSSCCCTAERGVMVAAAVSGVELVAVSEVWLSARVLKTNSAAAQGLVLPLRLKESISEGIALLSMGSVT